MPRINVDLKEIFFKALPSAVEGAEKEWQVIVSKYDDTSRHYHTFHHLRNMYSALEEYYKAMPPVASTLALFYHDFEYSTLRNDNEKQSATYAQKKLKQWNLPNELTEKVYRFIVATKNHSIDSDDEELKVFLDADMAVLGYTPAIFDDYITNVRKEYSIYPDFIYNKGRKDFLSKTLKGERIFLTQHFHNKYEQQARINLQNELNQLK